MAEVWTRWLDINNAKENERGYYGIYQIRIVDKVKKEALPIPRIGGVDVNGIIYIGKAEPQNSLGNRIDAFVKWRHSGGGTYELVRAGLKVKRHPYWKHQLQYRVTRLLPDKIAPDLAEIKELAKYFRKYCELPPCNSTVPEKWKRFLTELEESYGFELRD